MSNNRIKDALNAINQNERQYTEHVLMDKTENIDLTHKDLKVELTAICINSGRLFDGTKLNAFIGEKIAPLFKEAGFDMMNVTLAQKDTPPFMRDYGVSE